MDCPRDGKSDAAPCLQRLIDAAHTAKWFETGVLSPQNTTLVLPAGIYRLDSGLVVNSTIRMVGPSTGNQDQQEAILFANEPMFAMVLFTAKPPHPTETYFRAVTLEGRNLA